MSKFWIRIEALRTTCKPGAFNRFLHSVHKGDILHTRNGDHWHTFHCGCPCTGLWTLTAFQGIVGTKAIVSQDAQKPWQAMEHAWLSSGNNFPGLVVSGKNFALSRRILKEITTQLNGCKKIRVDSKNSGSRSVTQRWLIATKYRQLHGIRPVWSQKATGFSIYAINWSWPQFGKNVQKLKSRLHQNEI